MRPLRRGKFLARVDYTESSASDSAGNKHLTMAKIHSFRFASFRMTMNSIFFLRIDRYFGPGSYDLIMLLTKRAEKDIRMFGHSDIPRIE